MSKREPAGRKIDFGPDRPWTAHTQDHWLEFAGKPNVPDYLRIVFVAYGRHAANGHARLERGELAHLLVRKDGMLPDRRNIKASIDQAVALGFLDAGSRILCLMVSSDHAQGGVGDPNRRCDRDHTLRASPAARRANDMNESCRSPRNDMTETGRSSTKDMTGVRRFTLSPSLSSTDQDRVLGGALRAVPDADAS